MSGIGAAVGRVGSAGALALLLAGCAVFREPPPTITVAAKDARTRWESPVVGLRTSPATGRVEEVRREEFVDEYWVKSSDGEWYRVSKAAWQRARVGATLDLHPVLPEPRQPAGPCRTPTGAWWPCP